MKKASCVFLSILLLTGCMGRAAAISHFLGTAVRICYDCEDVTFDLGSPQEEADAVLTVLTGKRNN